MNLDLSCVGLSFTSTQTHPTFRLHLAVDRLQSGYVTSWSELRHWLHLKPPPLDGVSGPSCRFSPRMFPSLVHPTPCTRSHAPTLRPPSRLDLARLAIIGTRGAASDASLCQLPRPEAAGLLHVSRRAHQPKPPLQRRDGYRDLLRRTRLGRRSLRVWLAVRRAHSARRLSG